MGVGLDTAERATGVLAVWSNDKAAREAKRRWGNDAYVRNTGSMSSAESRQKHRDERSAALTEKKEIDDEIQARLEALDWYQDLMKRRREALKRADKNI